MAFHHLSSAKHHLECATEAVYGRHVQYTGGLCLSSAAECLKWAKPCKEAPALLSGMALVPASLTPEMKTWSWLLCLPPPILPALLVKQKQAEPLNAAVGLPPASGHREGSFQRKEVVASRWIPLWQQMKTLWLQNKLIFACRNSRNQLHDVIRAGGEALEVKKKKKKHIIHDAFAGDAD